jgi:precorrin-6y C5,15-methyltransferase (decarboxylating) CbiE subunit
MIECIGVGPGNLSFLTMYGADAISEADVVAGFDAVVDIVRPLIREDAIVVAMGYADQTKKLEQVAKLHHQGLHCVVCFMGDIHFSGFQYLERVERACGHSVKTIPGISSSQILASKAKVCFDETTFLTFHRRGDIEPFKRHLVSVLLDHRNAIIIPRPWDFMPKDIAGFLLEEGIDESLEVEVWENLTRDEATWNGKLVELAIKDFSDMSILLIRSKVVMPSQIEEPIC